MTAPDEPRGMPPGATADRPATSPFLLLSLATITAVALASPWIAHAATAVLGVESTTPIEWVPATFAPRQAYEQFVAEFGSGDVVVASWPGCTLDSPAIDRFVIAASGTGVACDREGRAWFESIVTGSQAVARLTAPPLSLSPETAAERLKGIIVGADGRSTGVVIPFTRAGLADRRRAVAWIRDTLLRTATPSAADIHLAGPVIDNVSVDAASESTLGTYGGPAALVILALTWWSLRSLRYALLVFVIALVCVGLSFWSLHAWGDRMNPVLIVMPLLVLTLGVSGGIHLVNYLSEASATGPREGVAARAIALGWLPCSLSAGTTALGLVSLVVSELEPIRVFGVHAAAGVLATLALLFLIVPGLFERWPLPARTGHGTEPAPANSWLAGLLVRRAGLVSSIAAVAMLVAVGGVPGIRTSVGIDTLFTPESRVIGDYRWIEQAIGPLVPIEVVLRFPDDSPLRPAGRLDLVRRVGAALGEMPGVTGVLSAATFLPELPEDSGLRSATRKAVMARRLEQSLANLVDMRVIRGTQGAQLWKVTARISALGGVDYGEFLADVRGRVGPLVAMPGVEADYTGVMPLVNAIQKTLLHDLFSSFLSACLVITLVMMMVERGVLAGLVAMVPNVFPMILLFGFLGWTRVALDIGSVMTASIALGMAVDGTFHFLTFFRRGLRRAAGPERTSTAAERASAIHDAYRHSAAALTQSALVCGLGILVFTGSSFAPSRRFAWMLATLVAAALVGDLILLPALLGSPLGRCFRPRAPSRCDCGQ